MTCVGVNSLATGSQVAALALTDGLGDDELAALGTGAHGRAKKDDTGAAVPFRAWGAVAELPTWWCPSSASSWRLCAAAARHVCRFSPPWGRARACSSTPTSPWSSRRKMVS